MRLNLGLPDLYTTEQGVQYTLLPEYIRNELESNTVRVQKLVQQRINNMNIQVNYLESFTIVINGFSVEVYLMTLTILIMMRRF
ncbi:hypothetical protein [Marinilactibacillus psychrotolerans]|uniref:Uncharacterized protein n=1 Tax=Marinilactibacillus psychrotolerans TaxID=191770 RepID=A0A5R9C7I3_9LACT|nr:hypothetical protein [Marinilactibacillus psychrotolerans]TLQ09153.1 hypothetical protein FEZ48_01550 [Marinilactibacillus psychrotolerans]